MRSLTVDRDCLSVSKGVEICFATRRDEPAIRAFIKEHWRSDHIFVTHPEVLRWQHSNPESSTDEMTFVLARDSDGPEDAEVIAILGYIPSRRFDPDSRWSELAIAMWKKRDHTSVLGLGASLMRRLEHHESPALAATIGINTEVRSLFVALGFTVDRFSHAALFTETPTYGETIASGVPASARRPIADDRVVLRDLRSNGGPDESSIAAINALSNDVLPRKSWTRIRNRYLRHPFYKYDARAVIVEDSLRAVIVWRRASCALGSVLRIVDFIGHDDALGRSGAALRREIALEGCQYMDCVHYGLSRAALAAAGFVDRDEYPELLLPNHFEPFEQTNIVLGLAFKLDPTFEGRRIRLFRGDGDQDRPNQLPVDSRPGDPV
jgi:hypothetical protein